ncbi:MAG: DUF1707 domain-containing protein [Actinomycetia bacterium]|nr:DUF1707 domain-containing protein [Actinomycetes bacterium]
MTDPAQMRVGDADRSAAVARLRQNRDAGRLTETELQERESQALAARTQGDLDMVFADLPPVLTSGTYDLYPHRAVVPADEPDPRPAESARAAQDLTYWPPSRQGFQAFLQAVPAWVWWVASACFLASLIGSTTSGYPGLWLPWWLVFFLPGVWNRKGDHRKR